VSTADDGTGERLLDAEALALFECVREMCGVVRDREWWTIEAARCGSDWAGVLALNAEAVAALRERQPSKRSA
jgi:hypothetical protein